MKVAVLSDIHGNIFARAPIVRDGQEATDHVITSLTNLPAIFSFSEAVKDMFLEANK